MTMQLPVDRPVGELELVHAFNKQMPVGFAISTKGRTFVTYPRWEIPVEFTLGEIVDGQERPFLSEEFISTQGIVIDKKDRLWVLDNASIDFGPIKPGQAKLVCIDLESNAIVKRISFGPPAVDEHTFLNDLRIDLSRGDEGFAYITDSGEKSSNGLIVVDLKTGTARRRLANHPSVKADDRFLGVVEGRPFVDHKQGQPPKPNKTGVDGIAISPNGDKIYYGPNAGRRLFCIPADVLIDPAATDDEVAAAVEDLGERGVSDGLGEDAAGNVYTTNYEHNAVLCRKPDGTYSTVVHDPSLLWPDTIVLHDGYLYVTANQLNRQAKFNDGKQLQQTPFALFRVRVDERPVRL
ncbi:MAG TPA: L-dopachrome tautomerase-related protein [Candidatus Aquilonibacter sp.]|nr:L-dopachrome tautomerase-related protein [Candidatus Aquilonibacter sp.]